MIYNGPATLVRSDGTEVEADLTLWDTRRGTLKSWQADGLVEAYAGDVLINDDSVTLRLPDGSTGVGFVARENPGPAGSVAIVVKGSGRPPGGPGHTHDVE